MIDYIKESNRLDGTCDINLLAKSALRLLEDGTLTSLGRSKELLSEIIKQTNSNDLVEFPNKER